MPIKCQTNAKQMPNNIPNKCQTIYHTNAKQCAKQMPPNKCQTYAKQMPNNIPSNIPNKCQAIYQTNAKQNAEQYTK